ncbi:hypothetical protein [Lysinibacillus sp. JNUCC-52]|uniref:hypothetical protein n=1 Tax=Lysinibacillus sp. JNUCC-52 TaxID=2792480 RepID=UPI001936EBF1|nr:hypothetical protein JNUCC52_17775 [Lysinibacillus sp. JNUCC-52]
MNESLLRVLIRAKEVNKWVALKHFVMLPVHPTVLMQLEDEGLLLIKRHANEGVLMKLTLKGYQQYKQISEE